MNKVFRIISILILIITFSGCSKDTSPPGIFILRDYQTQYNADKLEIENYLRSHSIAVDTEFNVTFSPTTLDAPNAIYLQNTYPLLDTLVKQNNIEYHVKYIKMAQGTRQRATQVDSVLVNYKGTFLKDTDSQFDASYSPIWFPLQNVISGWSYIIPNFKTGDFVPATPTTPSSFNAYGAGVMFLPSGLAYYAGGSGSIGAYTPIVFSFKLYNLQYRDHDRDGILSKDERDLSIEPLVTKKWTINPINYDSDGDGTANLYDIDEDGDTYTTKSEIKNPLTGLTNPFAVIPDCSGKIGRASCRERVLMPV